MTLTIAAYWWTSPPRTVGAQYHQYTPDDVRLLQQQVARSLKQPHEFVAITDSPECFADDADIRAAPLDLTTHVVGTCFARLMTFSPKARQTIGARVLQLDLDTVIVGELDPLVDRDEDLVMWRNPSRIPWDKPAKTGRPYYNTSMLLHRTGTKTELWERFNPMDPKYRDDQWLLSDKLGPDMPHWDGADGVYRLAREDTPGSGVSGVLPDNARVVTFPGSEGKCWDAAIAAANPWIAEFRR